MTASVDYLPPYSEETIQQILMLYCDGMAISDIEMYFGLDVNKVLDHYAPYLT